jgi:hypothetical protein
LVAGEEVSVTSWRVVEGETRRRVVVKESRAGGGEG